ncbi:hypothetical protein ACFODZ_02485 [Marinicella sediminis]|uniref:Uncharacterized protein n=1 Tax=Marinicella sediminis TaxID=1792834 RepID=A0ABV7J4M3_9GAMM|nr:hypothetical protein [Marinicella sediminis]
MSSDMFSARLIDALGLIPMQRKGQAVVVSNPTEQPTQSAMTTQPQDKPVATSADTPQLDKHEFRLLVNMLKAIGHDCQYDHIKYDGHEVRYQLHELTLVFNDINQADDSQHMNLSSLTDIISSPALKRPVWEKLKTIQV